MSEVFRLPETIRMSWVFLVSEVVRVSDCPAGEATPDVFPVLDVISSPSSILLAVSGTSLPAPSPIFVVVTFDVMTPSNDVILTRDMSLFRSSICSLNSRLVVDLSSSDEVFPGPGKVVPAGPIFVAVDSVEANPMPGNSAGLVVDEDAR